MPLVRYTDATADTIVERVSGGESLKTVCEDLMIPYTTVAKWIRNNLNGFGANMMDARRAAAGLLHDEMLQIANDCPLNAVAVARATMQIKTRQWLIDKLHPEKVVLPSQVDDEPIERPADYLRKWQEKNQLKLVNEA